ncbi:MAG: hypothetical protein RSA29_16105 [Clostridium sp.]|uniref:hypothetical protein n=1 Tax=Clostridium sp. TaxID=1506 RepID=UPI00302B2E00
MKSQLVRYEKLISEEGVGKYSRKKLYKSLKIKCLRRSRKGGILLYVLMISLCIFLCISFAMKSFDNRNFYIKNYKEHIMEEDISYRDREYLMVKFNEYMEKNIVEINKETIDSHFKRINVEDIFRRDKSFIKYVSRRNEFQVDAGYRIYPFVPIIRDGNITYYFKAIESM